jgi:hypothetical protein
MAYNKDQQKKMSYNFGTFFSSERKGNEFQLVKFGLYDGKFTLNFLKGTSGGGASEGGDAYTALEYETFCLLKQFIDNLVRSRVDRFRKGLPYEEVYVTYNITFQDKDSHETRTAGTLTFKTNTEAGSGKNIVHIYFTNGTNNFDIALGSPYLQKAFSHSDEQFTDIDMQDARLYALSYLIHNILNNWPSLIQNDRIASVIMNRIVLLQENYLTALFKKMEIPLPENNNGNYQEKYRSNKGGGASYSQDDEPF